MPSLTTQILYKQLPDGSIGGWRARPRMERAGCAGGVGGWGVGWGWGAPSGEGREVGRGRAKKARKLEQAGKGAAGAVRVG